MVNTGGVNTFGSYVSFLFKMFQDPRILPLPKILRLPVAATIALLRAPFGYKKYRIIGGSPVIPMMKEQAQLIKELSGCETHIACLYSRPLFEEMLKDKTLSFTVIPQFPHFSFTTYGCIIDRLFAFKRDDVKIAKPYYNHPLFIEAWRKAIMNAYFGEHVLFVAHGIPESLVKAGDPYERQIHETARLISESLNISNYSVAFQSRIGPTSWTKPYTEDAIKALAKKGIKEVMVVPISFTNEHLETLYDLDIELKSLASSVGIRVYKRVRVPYTSQELLKCWISVAQEAVDWRTMCS